MSLSLYRKPSALPSLSYAERGRLMRAEEVAAAVFGGHVSPRWIFQHVPAPYRHKVGRVALFYEGEIRAWLESLREVA